MICLRKDSPPIIAKLMITSDGRGAKAADRLAHSSLSWGAPNGNFLMYGMSDKNIETLLPIAKCWNSAPEIAQSSGCSAPKYIQEERAYFLDVKSRPVSLVINASKASPLVNPAFVLSAWESKQMNITVNGTRLQQGRNCRIGTRSTESGLQLVVWLKTTGQQKTTFVFASS
jgi:hypothetical protein